MFKYAKVDIFSSTAIAGEVVPEWGSEGAAQASTLCKVFLSAADAPHPLRFRYAPAPPPLCGGGETEMGLI